MAKANLLVGSRGYAMIVASSVLFGTYGIWSKVMGDQFGIFYQGWVRAALAIIILLPILLITKKFKKIERVDIKWMVLTTLFSAFTVAPIYYAFNHTSIGTATLLFYAIFIVGSYLLGRFLLGERLTIVKISSLILACIGLILVFGLSLAQFSILGLALAAFNGLASGGEVSSTKKITDKYSSLLVTFWCWVIIFVSHFPISLLLHEKQWAPAVTPQWGAMVAFAIAGTLAFLLVVEGFKHVDASIGSILGLLEIIWGVIFGAWLFREQVGPAIYVGALFILLAGALPDINALREGRKLAKPIEPPREL